MFSTTSAVALAFAVAASAHMIMVSPVPYSSPQVQQSPLLPSGDNFPCQLSAGMTPSGTAAEYALGSSQSLKFIGQAVHGGGSCQVSITYDNPPTKDSVFRVIHSIQGGCPAKGQTGNMGDSASAPDPFTYDFTIPTDIPAGEAVVAWTWFNKIGNREMYMNCAPVKLTGSGGDKSNFDKLPEILKANIGNGCSTTEGTDIEFPNPGDSVVNLNVGTTVFAGPVGSCGSTVAAQPAPSQGPPAGGSGPSSSIPAYNPASVPTSAPAPSSDAPAGGVFATVAPSASATASAPQASAPPAQTPASQPPASQPPAVGTAAQAPGSACSDEGAWSCQGTAYQRCASGMWSAVMPLAAGTSCTETGGNFNIVAAGAKVRRLAVPFRG